MIVYVLFENTWCCLTTVVLFLKHENLWFCLTTRFSWFRNKNDVCFTSTCSWLRNHRNKSRGDCTHSIRGTIRGPSGAIRGGHLTGSERTTNQCFHVFRKTEFVSTTMFLLLWVVCDTKPISLNTRCILRCVLFLDVQQLSLEEKQAFLTRLYVCPTSGCWRP